MAQEELGGFARRQIDGRRARLHADAARMLGARSALRRSLPPGYGQGPLTDMLLWLYLHPDESEERLYQAADLSRSTATATRWLAVLLKDGLSVRRATGPALTDAGVAMVEAALENLPPVECISILQ